MEMIATGHDGSFSLPRRQDDFKLRGPAAFDRDELKMSEAEEQQLVTGEPVQMDAAAVAQYTSLYKARMRQAIKHPEKGIHVASELMDRGVLMDGRFPLRTVRIPEELDHPRWDADKIDAEAHRDWVAREERAATRRMNRYYESFRQRDATEVRHSLRSDEPCNDGTERAQRRGARALAQERAMARR